jgi:hypothetical protein
MLQMLCDGIAGLLRIPGDALRNLLLLVPLPAARILFLLIPVVLAVVVLRQPKEDLAGSLIPGARAVSLRPWILVSLAVIFVIYLTF